MNFSIFNFLSDIHYICKAVKRLLVYLRRWHRHLCKLMRDAVTVYMQMGDTRIWGWSCWHLIFCRKGAVFLVSAEGAGYDYMFDSFETFNNIFLNSLFFLTHKINIYLYVYSLSVINIIIKLKRLSKYQFGKLIFNFYSCLEIITLILVS